MKRALLEAETAVNRAPKMPSVAKTETVVEKALRESEARFRDLVALSSDWYWEQDDQFRFTTWAGGALGKVGLRTDEGVGKTRWELPYVGVTTEQWSEHKATLVAHQAFKDFELCRIDGMGRMRWFSISGHPIFDEHGIFKGYRGTGTDITEQRQREEALLQFRAAIDATADGIHIVDCDSMTFLDVNKTAYCSLGYTREEFLKLRIEDISPGMDMGKLALRYARMFDGTEVSQSNEITHRHKSGRVVPIEIHRSGTVVNGRRIVVNVVRDITDRKAEQAALRESEARFRDLIEFSLDWYWEQDENYRFTIMTGSTLTPGDQRKDLLGRTRWEMDGVQWTVDEQEAHRADLDARRPFRDVIVPIKNTGGSQRYVKISGKPFYDQGIFKGYRGVTTDITKQKLDQDALRESEARFRDLIQFSRDGYWEQDENYRFTILADQLGTSRKHLLGRTRWDQDGVQWTADELARHRADLDARRTFHVILPIKKQMGNGDSSKSGGSHYSSRDSLKAIAACRAMSPGKRSMRSRFGVARRGSAT